MAEIRWEECAYFMRGLPGADPEGTCSFGCREEPNCYTGRPAEGWSPWDAQVDLLGSQCAALTAENVRLTAENERLRASEEVVARVIAGHPLLAPTSEEAGAQSARVLAETSAWLSFSDEEADRG